MAARGNIDFDQVRLAARQGDGPQFQMSRAVNPVGGNVPIYDAYGNLIDSGVGPGGGGSGTYFGLSNFTAPPLTGWTADNISNITYGTGVLDFTYNYPYLVAVKAGLVNVGVAYRTAPSAPYTSIACLLHDMSGAPPLLSGAGSDTGYTFGFRDGTGKIVTLLTNNGQVVVSHFTSSTSFSANVASYGPANGVYDLVLRNPIWLSIKDDGTDTKFYISLDGNHFDLFYSESRTAFFGSGPTQICFGGYVDGGGSKVALISYRETSP